MKKVVLNYVVIAALAVAAAFTSCGGGSGSGSGGGKSSGKIKMTTEEGGDFSFRLAGSGVATVDWGDGSEKVSLTLSEGRVGSGRGVQFHHTYPNASIRTITIDGDNIMALECRYITSLDVSRCSELIQLDCTSDNLKKLDVSKNTALTDLQVNAQLSSLDLSKNVALLSLGLVRTQLTSLDVSKNTALTGLLVSGNQLTSSAINALFGTLHSNDVGVQKRIYIGGDGDRSIAEKKGWTVQ